ncbi:beta-lactamase/transpeptidase-like protein [Podospora aff. communis PSN243]|uniref:Beta-lactamase/transpeptidase-like protein n=1 Tax=Podospora aff. communis PSN243 TaxID=3040156 RepID=A0AAV9H3M9_9PEZI|nr:beta-lactamase/transpeptidase-like protein [Podospora aff. communis PSN243]
MKGHGIAEGLRATGPAINSILASSGTAGAAVGVLHHGEIIHTAGYGFRDLDRRLPMDQNSVVSLFSLTKFMTSAAIGSLVDSNSNAASWDSTFASLVPGFRHHNATVQKETTLRDLLSHRVGLAQYNALFMQDKGRLYLDKSETLNTASALPLTAGFREKFQYNNWNYALAALTTQSLANLSLGEYLVKHFFEPLEMKNTTVVRPPDGSSDISEGYMALSSGTPARTERPFAGNDQIMFGAMGVNSCVKDLLIFYGEALRACNDQLARKTTSTEGSPFKQVSTMWSSQIPLPDPSLLERSYAFGLFRVQLPQPMTSSTMNNGRIPRSQIPVVGKGAKPQLALYHGGNSAASQNWVILLPETQSAVVVLTNTMANCDAANLIGSMLLEELLESPEKNDYEELSRVAAKAGVEQWHALHASLEKKRVPGTKPKPLEAYTGKYWNHVGNFYIEVFLDKEGGELAFCLQGDKSMTYKLHHYNYDVFCWVLTQDENAATGRFPYTSEGQWLLRFEGESDAIGGLRWNQNGVKDGEFFHKGEYCKSYLTAN